MAKPLVSLGFMTAKLSPGEAALEIKKVFDLVARKVDVVSRLVALLSGDGSEMDNISPLRRLSSTSEVIVLSNCTVSRGRHRLFGSGFIDEADFILVCDLDRKHPAETVAKLVLDGLQYPGSVLIPQNEEARVVDNSYTIDQLALAFENYFTAAASGLSPREYNCFPQPLFESGLFFFRERAVKELLRCPWRFDGDIWDLELALFAIRGDERDRFHVGYPLCRLSHVCPSFDAGRSVQKINCVAQISGRSSVYQIREDFGDFQKKFGRFLRALIADKYIDKVIGKI